MKADVIDRNGNVKENIELSDNVFNIDVKKHVINEAIKNELNNRRQGTAKTKERTEIAGANTKPWRQKGLGRARAGSRKSPIWTGGGTTFGPRPRDYSYKLPKKVKRLAIKSIFSDKVKNDRVTIIEDINLDEIKTNKAVELLLTACKIKNTIAEAKNNNLKKALRRYRMTIILTDEDKELKRALRNIPWVKTLSYNRLSSHRLFYSNEIVILKKAAEKLNEQYEAGSK